MTDEIMSTPTGDKIRKRRAALGLTAQTVAERSGMSIATLFAIERGTVLGPRLSTLRKIAATLGVEINEIIG